MSLNAAIEDTLTRLRAAARSRMRSRVSIRRRVDGTTADRTGRKPSSWPTVAVNVPARLKPRGSRAGKVGDTRVELATAEVHLPWDHTELRDNDYLVFTTGQWAGRIYQVTEAVAGDQQTARRIPVEETSRPWPAEPTQTTDE